MRDSLAIKVITGPTASGKSAAAISLAHHDPSIEIVNADAQLLYKGFDIGTAKPALAERELVPHHLIDILEPHERYSAADFSAHARKIIREIVKRGKTPIVVGGTGFYIEALFHGLSPDETKPEVREEARKKYVAELDASSFSEMHEKLREIDPELYAQIAREMNPLRLQRAWVQYYATGMPLGEARKQERDTFEYTPDYQVIELARPDLWRRIEQRVDGMLTHGWMREVDKLLAAGVTTEMPAMKAIGYREIAAVVTGVMKQTFAREQVIIRTRQYAKRQMTWIRHSMH